MKNIIKIFIILLISFSSLSSFAQDQAKIDSLKQVITTTKQACPEPCLGDTTKIKTLLKLGDQYKNIIPDTALFYYQKALKIAQNNKEQKFKAKSLRSIGIIYKNQGNYPKALEYDQKALKIDTEIGDKSGIARNLGNIGVIYWNQGNYPKALSYYQKALKMFTEIGYKRGIATALGNIGNIYYYQGNYPQALSYYQKALKMFTEIGNKSGIARNLGNIGIIYRGQGNYPKALEYDQKALKIKTEIGDKDGIARNLGNIGIIYDDQGNYLKALEYYQKALKMFTEIGDKSGIALNLGNIGIIYENQGNYPKALEYYQKALKIYTEIGNKSGIALNLGNIGNLYKDLKQYKKALDYEYKALKIAKEIGSLKTQKEVYSILSEIYKGQKKYEMALAYKDSFIVVKDSLFNDEKTKDIAKLESKYEYEKKAAMDSTANAKQMEIKNAQIARINTEKEAQRRQRNFLLIGLVLVLVFVVFVIRSYIQKRKANTLLQKQKQEIGEKNEELNQQAEELQLLNENLYQQNEEITAQRDEITHQKNIIEEIHHEVEQSIDYATRLQQSILSEEKLLTKYVSDHFVFFRPKDKVSGDFYWWTHIENHTIITAADCTGHGVPGAFMSMLGTSFLREIVEKEYITNTGLILKKLRKEIIKALKQKGESGEQKDGMDMAIISIDHETNMVQFSGANNPLYIITNRNLQGFENLEGLDGFYEIKPDKMPIAIYEKMDNFTTHEIQLEKGDQLYLFSDGFADQFGGAKGKKFKYKPFKRLLLENSEKPMQEQKAILDNAFETWKGNLEQIDDVVVLGVKI